MKQIEVVAAIIHDDEGRIFATQRGYGDFKDGWEFPGGKMEPGESPEDALKREIWEELETRIVVERLVKTVEWEYPKFFLKMHCFWCHIESGSLILKEHEAARWLSKDQLNTVAWLPADKDVVELIANKKAGCLNHWEQCITINLKYSFCILCFLHLFVPLHLF